LIRLPLYIDKAGKLFAGRRTPFPAAFLNAVLRRLRIARRKN
jgi:hypothetical protein